MVPNCLVYAAIRAFRYMTLFPHLLANLRVEINKIVRIIDFPELIQVGIDKIFHAMQPHNRQRLRSLLVFSYHFLTPVNRSERRFTPNIVDRRQSECFILTFSPKSIVCLCPSFWELYC